MYLLIAMYYLLLFIDYIYRVVYPPYTAREKRKLSTLNFVQTPSSRRWSYKPIIVLLMVALVAYLVQVSLPV